MKWITGEELAPADRAHVLNAYVHRMTTEARQRWPDFAAFMLRNGYRMPARDDAEWLAMTRFAVRSDGRLDSRVRRCETTFREANT